jgi:hypothetical protein
MHDFVPSAFRRRQYFVVCVDMGSGVPMARSWVRLATCVVSGAAFLVLNGCGAQPDDGYSTPPPSSYGSAPQASLSGGPTPPTRRRADDAGLAGGPATGGSGAYAGMDPVANPRDMPLAECLKIYGDRCTGKGAKGMRTYKRADGMIVVSMDPIANPEDMSPAERRRVYPARYAARAATAPARRRSYYAPPTYAAAPVVRPAPKPAATVAYKPAPPVAPAPAPKPVYVPAPAAVAPAAPVAQTPAPPPAAPMTATDKLSAAVKGEATKGATLTVPDSLSKGQEAKVTLTLPQDLLAIIQREAGKLGLTRQAKKAEVSATLSGQGYVIDPPGKQTKPLASGQATSFDWQVKPGTGEKAPLRADVDGTLTGSGKPQSFSLASLEQAMAGAVDDAKAKAKGFTMPHFSLPKFSLDSLTWPGMPTLDLGPVKAKTGNVSAILIGLVALFIAWMLARGAGANRARAERRRKYRTMTDYGRNEMEPAEPAPAAKDEHHDDGHGYVNPMIAAAGGAALGAAAAHAHDEHEAHDDHGHDNHGHDDHAAVAPLAEAGHDDHSHDAHGHDAHGHDDHHAPASLTSNDGHGHDDHGHHDDHDAHAAPAPDAGHDDPSQDGHDDHGHDAHGHGHDDHTPPATLVSTDSHDDHHAEAGHDDHGTDSHAAPEADHSHDAHGHDDHGHDDHAHKDHHEHEHA